VGFLTFLSQQSFGYGPRAKRSRSNTRAGLVGYLFETAHNAIAPMRQAGAAFERDLEREVAAINGAQHNAVLGTMATWLARYTGLSGGIAGSDQRHLLPAAKLCFQRRCPIVHAGALECFQTIDGEPPVSRAGAGAASCCWPCCSISSRFVDRLAKVRRRSGAAAQMSGYEHVNFDPPTVRGKGVGGKFDLNSSIVGAKGGNAIEINERRIIPGVHCPHGRIDRKVFVPRQGWRKRWGPKKSEINPMPRHYSCLMYVFPDGPIPVT
jgi:hypothetical protein